MVALSSAASIAAVLKGLRDPEPVPLGLIVLATLQLFVKLEVL